MNQSVTSALGALKTWKFWKELIVLTVGMLIGGAAVYYFMLPGNLILGQVSGLAMVITGLFGLAGITVRVSVVVTLINILLLILAIFLVGKEFGAKNIYTSLILGPCLEFWDRVLPYQKLMEPGATSVMNDVWLDLLCFVLVLSVCQTILFSANASSGGLDILAKIANKFFHWDIGTCVTITGALICCTAFAVNPFRLVVVGLVGTWLNGLTLDYFMASISRRKRVCIISEQHETIRKYIIEQLNRGCSLYEVIGGYTNEKSIEVQALLTKDEFANLMAYLKDNDIKAFTTAGNVSEIYGLWSKNSRHSI